MFLALPCRYARSEGLFHGTYGSLARNQRIGLLVRSFCLPLVDAKSPNRNDAFKEAVDENPEVIGSSVGLVPTRFSKAIFLEKSVGKKLH